MGKATDNRQELFYIEIKEIELSELEKIMDDYKVAFLCGNGFSINFDKEFSTIYDRLYDAHKFLLDNIEFDVYPKSGKVSAVFKDNYKEFIRYIRRIDEFRFEKIFKDGIIFADSIISNQELLNNIDDKLNHLVFDKTQIDLVKNIAEQGNEYGYKKVNIEYWPVLIYMYFIIKHKGLDSKFYTFPINNEFIKCIEKGRINRNKILNEDYDIQYQISSGFNIYYRSLMCTAILNGGKAINFEQLNNRFNKNNVVNFMNKFVAFMTLNYDSILEHFTEKPITHLHGSFVNNKEFVYFISLGINLPENQYVSFSDILIGDYFVNKTFMSVVNSNKNRFKNIPNISEKIYDVVKKNEIDIILIFGMNINNDQHIIRNLVSSLNSNKNAMIIYCYYLEDDKKDFEIEYNKCLADLDKKIIENIKVKFIRSDKIIEKYFY